MTAPAIGVAATYRALRHQRVCALLGRWVSGLEPVIFERVDVSPQILAEFGIGAVDSAVPHFVDRVTVQDMINAGALA